MLGRIELGISPCEELLVKDSTRIYLNECYVDREKNYGGMGAAMLMPLPRVAAVRTHLFELKTVDDRRWFDVSVCSRT